MLISPTQVIISYVGVSLKVQRRSYHHLRRSYNLLPWTYHLLHSSYFLLRTSVGLIISYVAVTISYVGLIFFFFFHLALRAFHTEGCWKQSIKMYKPKFPTFGFTHQLTQTNLYSHHSVLPNAKTDAMTGTVALLSMLRKGWTIAVDMIWSPLE